MMPILSQSEKIITVNGLGKVRQETLRGRPHLVAPATTIVPGVLPGSQGRLLYPPDEIARNHSDWNGTPIVIYHPVESGRPVSARKRSVIDNAQVGVVLESVYNGKLQHELWFDVEDLKRVDRKYGTNVYNRLLKNDPIELSTGLYTTNDPVPKGSNWYGTPYDAVARNYRPDHLAILPDQKGACSLQDGCGVLVNKSSAEGLPMDGKWEVIEINGERREVYTRVYNQTDPPTDACKCGGECDSCKAKKKGGVMNAREVFINDIVANCSCEMATANEVLKDFDENQLRSVANAIRGLTANANFRIKGRLSGTDGGSVTSLGATGIMAGVDQANKELKPASGATALAGSVLRKTQNAEDDDDDDEDDMPEKKKGRTDNTDGRPNKSTVKSGIGAVLEGAKAGDIAYKGGARLPSNNQGATVTENEFIESLPPAYREAVENAMVIVEQKKAEIIGRLVANVAADQQPGMVQYLMGKKLPELQNLETLLPKPRANVTNQAGLDSLGFRSYLGNSVPALSANASVDDKDDLLDIPTANSLGLK